MVDAEYPLVSAIMLAGHLPAQDIVAGVRCFLQQTYPYKELIVVNNAMTQFEAGAFNLRAERNVFLIDTPAYVTAGMARNFGINAANGRILAQFDADHWFDKDRLALQVAALGEHQVQASMLSSSMSYSYATGRASHAIQPQGFVPHSLVFLRPEGIDYPDAIKAEEIGLIDRLHAAGWRFATIDRPTMACKLRFTRGEQITKPTGILPKAELQAIRGLLKQRAKWLK